MKLHEELDHFHMKGFALRLVLKQRHKRTREWPIVYEMKVVEGFQGFFKGKSSYNDV